MILWGRLRQLLPDSVFARIAGLLLLNFGLIWLVAFALYQISSGGMAFDDDDVPARVASAVQLLDSLPPEQRERVARALSDRIVSVRVGSPRRPPPPEPAALQEHDRDFKMQIFDSFPKDLPPPTVWLPAAPSHPEPPEPRITRVAIGLDGGGLAEFHIWRGPPPFRWHPLLTLIVSICLVVYGFSIVFARGVSHRLAAFANAAEALGRTEEVPPIPERGPREIRLATHAFNRMQERLHRFVLDRTQMLAAISHDLRTPLTRLRLRAEFVDDEPQRERMLHDIAEMEAMIAATLAFARDDVTREARREEDLDQLVDDLATVMREAGQDVAYTPIGPLTLTCSPVALRRALGNLIENAVKYGQRARVCLGHDADHVLVHIDDDGPGIPQASLEQVFQPFFRLEGSRNRDTGGVGLGLAIARTTVRGHGGDILLENRPGGGLRATVSLPA